jgi:hypothetical protein
MNKINVKKKKNKQKDNLLKKSINNRIENLRKQNESDCQRFESILLKFWFINKNIDTYY